MSKKCFKCGSAIDTSALFCDKCGHSQKQGLDFSKALNKLSHKSNMGLTDNKIKTALWFVGTNGAIVISLSIISSGGLNSLIPFFLVIGGVTPFLLLLFSKNLAKKAHNIVMITENNIQSKTEEGLYELIREMSQKTNLDKMPEVGIYESDDINAFATGMNKNNSMVAFSTALLEKIDEESIAAVAAHEISHIANGDMITLSIIQGAINVVVMLITIPLYIIKIGAFFSEEIGAFGFIVISLAKAVITAVLLFLANLIVNFFSRKREYEADKFAAQLYDKNAMISALKEMSRQTVQYPKEQKAYAAFKISGVESFLEIFSTHPNIENRIKRLEEI